MFISKNSIIMKKITSAIVAATTILYSQPSYADNKTWSTKQELIGTINHDNQLKSILSTYLSDNTKIESLLYSLENIIKLNWNSLTMLSNIYRLLDKYNFSMNDKIKLVNELYIEWLLWLSFDNDFENKTWEDYYNAVFSKICSDITYKDVYPNDLWFKKWPLCVNNSYAKNLQSILESRLSLNQKTTELRKIFNSINEKNNNFSELYIMTTIFVLIFFLGRQRKNDKKKSIKYKKLLV